METRNKYTFVEHNLADTIGIRLTEEQYGGLILSINRVAFVPKPDSDEMFLKFDYDVLSNPKELSEELNAPSFTKLIGDIIVDILDGQMSDGVYCEYDRPSSNTNIIESTGE
jgi:hypothetical protein